MKNINDEVDPSKKLAEKNDDRKSSLLSDRPCSNQPSRSDPDKILCAINFIYQ